MVSALVITIRFCRSERGKRRLQSGNELLGRQREQPKVSGDERIDRTFTQWCMPTAYKCGRCRGRKLEERSLRSVRRHHVAGARNRHTHL